MLDFFVHPFFKYFLLPISAAVAGAALNYASRNDQYARLKKEHFAVGLDLILTACLMYVVLTTDRIAQLSKSTDALSSAITQGAASAELAILQQEVQGLSREVAASGWFTVLLFVGLFSTSVLVRKLGWKSDAEMNTTFGVVVPLVFGVLCMIGVMAAAS